MKNIDRRVNMDETLKRYQRSFAGKVYSEENEDLDVLMEVFSLTPALKRENRQYWGRELGFCWQLLIIEACRLRNDFNPAFKVKDDEPCDLTVGKLAIDTKYRIGSGDSGTLKKFKNYGPLLKDMGYDPVFLILREDNLRSAIQACRVGGWRVLAGEASFNFLEELTGFDLKGYLVERAGRFAVTRSG